MRNPTRCALAALVLTASACGNSRDQTAQPQTPPMYSEQTTMPEPAEQAMTPAASTGTESQPMTETEPAEPATPPAPAPIKLQHGDASHDIVQVVLVKDPKMKQKDRLMFFDAQVSCDEIFAAKNKMPESLVLATDVKSEGDSIQMAQPMKWTYYDNGKATPINAKKENVTLNVTNESGRMMGDMNITTKIKNVELSGSGPFAITTCDAAQSSTGSMPGSSGAPTEMKK